MNPQPSTRISVLNMFPYLRDAGFDPHVLFEPPEGNPEPDLGEFAALARDKSVRIAYFQKVRGPKVLAVANDLARQGVRTVYGVCDFVDNCMAEVADATVVVTDYLKGLYRPDLQHKIHVVHDGIERPDLHKASWSADRGSARKPLRAILVTSSDLDHIPALESVPPFANILVVGKYPPRSDLVARINWARWTFARKTEWSDRRAFICFLMNGRVSRITWSPETAYSLMRDADIGIIPADMFHDPVPGASVSWWQVKSENRLTMKMSMGLPVVASPVPSYLPVIAHGENGLIAKTAEDWRSCLEMLRDPRVRKEMGERARESVSGRFSMENQAARLIEILRRVADC